jgi:hypothetical protein
MFQQMRLEVAIALLIDATIIRSTGTKNRYKSRYRADRLPSEKPRERGAFL